MNLVDGMIGHWRISMDAIILIPTIEIRQ